MNKYGWFINQREDLLETALLSKADAWTLIDVNPECIPIARRIREVRPNARIVMRYYQNPTPLGEDPAQNAVRYYNERYLQHREITKMVMPANEPQLETVGVNPDSYESVTDMWWRLNSWMRVWAYTFRMHAPDAFIIFPSPAPGVFWDDARGRAFDGIPSDDGIDICTPAIQLCDAVGQNIYWDGNGHGLYSDREWYASRYAVTAVRTGKPVFITECNSDVMAFDWHMQMVNFWQQIKRDERVIGATCFLLQGHGEQFSQHDVSRRPNVKEDMQYFAQILAEGEITMPTPAFDESLRRMLWDMRGVNYNPSAAFLLYARDHALGNPITNEFSFVYGGATYLLQGFALGIVYAVAGDWGNVKVVPW